MGRLTFLFVIVVIISACTCVNRVMGDTDLNAVVSGDWTDANTWEGGLDIPGGTDDAQIQNNLTITINAGDAAVADRVILGDNIDNNTGTLTMTGGTLSTDRPISLGGFEVVGTNGTGILNQSGGDIYIGAGTVYNGFDILTVGDSGTSTGIYNLSGGTLDAPEGLYVAHMSDSTGEVNQTGGQITTTIAYLGRRGSCTYTMDAGSLTATSSFYLGRYAEANGTFNQSNGSVSIGGDVTIADYGNAQYTMTGGTFDVTGRFIVGRRIADPNGLLEGVLNQSSGTLSVTDTAWIANVEMAKGTYNLSGDAVANFASDLNVCAALGMDGSTSPSGATGTLNIDGEGVTITVGGNLVATGGTVLDPEELWVNTSNFNFTTGATSGVSTIDVTGTADIDGAIFDIIESTTVAPGTILNLIETDGGISNFATAILSQNAIDNDWTLQLGGTSNEILQAVKTLNVVVPGDTNNDGIVNSQDAEKLASNWGAPVGTAGPSEGDFNGDGVVNALDASILAANWGDHNEAQVGAAVPEPTVAMLLLSLVATLLIGRRYS